MNFDDSNSLCIPLCDQGSIKERPDSCKSRSICHAPPASRAFLIKKLFLGDQQAAVCLHPPHGTLTPGSTPLRSLGVTAHGADSRFNARPVTTQKYHYPVSCLGLQKKQSPSIQHWLLAHPIKNAIAYKLVGSPITVRYLLICICSCQSSAKEKSVRVLFRNQQPLHL